MQILFLSMLTLLVSASPAAAVLVDQEPSNDSMSTAAIQMTRSGAGAVTADGGVFSFTTGGGDIDFLGIGGLFAGDAVIVSTTPQNDPPDLNSPDTLVGLFNSTETLLCLWDDAFNNDLDGFSTGRGSLCRLAIPAAGDYFVGVTGDGTNPFDGVHSEEGDYSLTVTVVRLGATPTATTSAAAAQTAEVSAARCPSPDIQARATGKKFPLARKRGSPMAPVLSRKEKIQLLTWGRKETENVRYGA
jgi:hypothetical protein